MLSVKDASFFYDRARRSGFGGLDFDLKPGEVLCILGPNGCGKTTLLKCLVGLLKVEGGRISLNGREVSQMGRRDLAKVIGYVPQLHIPAFPFSVLDAVLVGRAPHLNMLESPGKEDEEVADTALRAMGIEALRDRPYTQLSGGEIQLVLFARVLAQQPALLLLDEPTSHLDFGNQIRTLHLIQELSSTGLPIVMTSHFPDHAFLASSKVAIMKDNRFLAVGTPEEVITVENMERIYGIKVSIVDVDGPAGRRICVPMRGGDGAGPDRHALWERLANVG